MFAVPAVPQHKEDQWLVLHPRFPSNGLRSLNKAWSHSEGQGATAAGSPAPYGIWHSRIKPRVTVTQTFLPRDMLPKLKLLSGACSFIHFLRNELQPPVGSYFQVNQTRTESNVLTNCMHRLTS